MRLLGRRGVGAPAASDPVESVRFHREVICVATGRGWSEGQWGRARARIAVSVGRKVGFTRRVLCGVRMSLDSGGRRRIARRPLRDPSDARRETQRAQN